eukprot:scpid20932/ scgid29939/ 
MARSSLEKRSQPSAQHTTCHTRDRTSSPKYPQSNGEAERAVRTAKNLLRKSDNLHDALLAYCSTPLANGYSPCQLLYGRQLRTGLPSTTDQLQPQWPDLTTVCDTESHAQEQQKQHFDKRHAAKPLPQLIPHDRVWITDLEREGIVLEQVSNRSYSVKAGPSTLRRNRRHLVCLPRLETDGAVDVAYGTAQPTAPLSPVPSRSARETRLPDRLIESC